MAGINVTLAGKDLVSGNQVYIEGQIGRTGFAPGHPLPEPPPGSGSEPPTIWPGPGDPDYPIQLPPGIWPDPGPLPHPEHPIVIPPPPNVQGPQLEVKIVWTPQTGWQVVLIPTGTHPAPSR